MPRKYELKKRAERQEETRRRIVEAAVALHGEIGPARTTVSAIAERAGVERHTYYRHFPDERTLSLACSGHFFELNPAPDVDAWRAVTDPAQRLESALTELYAYYARNTSMFENVSRDAQVHALTAEVQQLRFGPWMAAAREALADGLGGSRREVLGAIDVALSFATWRSLAAARLGRATAADVMTRAVLGVAG